MTNQNIPNQNIGNPPDDVIVTKNEEHAYGYIMEVLTRGLYPDKLHVIREYVQNGFDSIVDFRRKGFEPEESVINIKISPPSLFIYDSGIGMNAQKMAEYRYVGYSTKATSSSVGFRGIGKLSGISAAEKIIVTTSPLGLPERHQLIFDAEAMLQHVENLKIQGKNIALNQLIQKYTSLSTTTEDIDSHYTQIELYKIRQDSQLLLDKQRIFDYLSLTAPVDFDPNFEYGTQLDQDLREYVPDDYETVPLYVDDDRVYKPYFRNTKPPQRIFVWDSENTNSSSPLAFCWYCEHNDKGQFPDEMRRGLFFRVKNFSVGDNQLPRVTLWHSTPERAFYFFGEIHVIDPGIIPSADRTNFEQNENRERLYSRASEEISRSLNRVAGKSSDTRRAIDFIQQAESTINQVKTQIDDGGVPSELKISRIVNLSKAVENVQKRFHNAPDEFKERARDAIEQGELLIEELDQRKITDPQNPSPIYDIKEELGLGKEASWVYDAIISILKSEIEGDIELFEKIINRIHTSLRKYKE